MSYKLKCNVKVLMAINKFALYEHERVWRQGRTEAAFTEEIKKKKIKIQLIQLNCVQSSSLTFLCRLWLYLYMQTLSSLLLYRLPAQHWPAVHSTCILYALWPWRLITQRVRAPSSVDTCAFPHSNTQMSNRE